MRTGRPKQPLTIDGEERERLEALAHRSRSQALLARRARVVLACAEGLDNPIVARKLRCSVSMVGKWRARFLKGRLEALYDEPRPGTPRTVSDAQVEQVVIQTLETTPRGETHWSTRGLAKATGYAQSPSYGPAKLGETYKIYLDAARAKQELGWQPEIDLDDGLRQTVVAAVRIAARHPQREGAARVAPQGLGAPQLQQGVDGHGAQRPEPAVAHAGPHLRGERASGQAQREREGGVARAREGDQARRQRRLPGAGV